MVRRRRPPRAGAIEDHAPLRILRQILLLQAAYYASAFVLLLFTALVAGKRFSVDFIFGWQRIRFDNTDGWMLGLCWMLNSLVGAILLLLLVNRSKLVADFALTIHFIHFLIVSLTTHEIPKNLSWWILQAASSGVMIALGIWACQWRELRPLSFGGVAAKAKTTAALGPHELGEEGVEGAVSGEGVFLRMLSRVRRNTVGDARGDYELADIQERMDEHG